MLLLLAAALVVSLIMVVVEVLVDIGTGTTPIGAHPVSTTIQVGAGGADPTNTTQRRGLIGSPSYFGTPITAAGGGGGGVETFTKLMDQLVDPVVAVDGQVELEELEDTPPTSPSQGNPGGDGQGPNTAFYACGGGGGAGGAGTTGDAAQGGAWWYRRSLNSHQQV